MRLSFPPFSFAYRQLYFLQLENYELGRFLKLLPRSYTFSSPPRQELTWTPKLVALQSLALLLEAAAAVLVSSFFPGSAVLAAIALFALYLLCFHFLFLVVAALLFSPFDAVAKRGIIAAARAALAARPDVKVVAVAGSYGKTTMKEALVAVLSQKFKVLSTSGNLNTPLGISRTILSGLAPDTQMFIVEMGEHKTGDLAFLTKLAPPYATVITGIGEAHLERFGSFNRLVEGIFEAVQGTASGKLVVLNADNTHIVHNYERYIDGHEIAFYSSKNNPPSAYAVSHESFRDDGSGMSFVLAKEGHDLGEFSLPLLGGYAPGVAVAALIVAEKFGMRADEAKRGLATMKPIPHRLEVVPSKNGVLVIDDSYNGNPEGARYAIETLARFKGRRKIYITPGLVETGLFAEKVHEEIGQALAKVADLVVLIQNSVTPFIVKGLKEGRFPEDQIRFFKDAPAAHAAIPEIVKTGDVVLFQNDWPDNYA